MDSCKDTLAAGSSYHWGIWSASGTRLAKHLKQVRDSTLLAAYADGIRRSLIIVG
jgi:hypothetical protein